jgi:hypothetical protein
LPSVVTAKARSLPLLISPMTFGWYWMMFI